MTKRIIRNKHICYILIALGGAAIFFATTMAAGGTLFLAFLIVGLAGAVLLLIGTIWLRAIEDRQFDEERAAARRRSLRLIEQEEGKHYEPFVRRG